MPDLPLSDLPWLLFAPTAILIGGALLQVLVAGFASNATKGWLAFIATAGALAAAVALIPHVADGQALTAQAFFWDTGVALAYRIDGLSVLFMVMGCAMGALILLYAIGYMAHERKGAARFFFLMQVFIAGLMLLVGADSLLVAYIAWELIGLCSFFLVSFWYARQASADGARVVLLVTHLAGYGFFAAILVVYGATGTFVWSDPAVAGAFTTGVVILMIVAAMAKSVMYPLHAWIPHAMHAPTPVSALLHSACYVKAGAYLIARMYTMGDWHPAGGDMLLVIACVTMVVGVVFALAQTDLKRLLAFHTVSQLGYIMAGLALGTDLGLAAGLVYILSHAMFKGALFLCAGSVQHATGTRDLREVGGLAKRMPVTAWVWLTASAAIAGVPLTIGFVSKWLLFTASLDAGQAVVAFIAAMVSVLTAFSFLKASVGAFFGAAPASLKLEDVRESPPTMQAAMICVAILCVLFGIAPQLLAELLVKPAVLALGFSWELQASWAGIVAADGAGSLGVTLGALAVLVVSVLIGLAAHALTREPAGGRVNVYTGGDPLPEGNRLDAEDFAGLLEDALAPVYRADPEPAYARLGRATRRVADGLRAVADHGLEARPALAVAIGGGVMIAGVWAL